MDSDKVVIALEAHRVADLPAPTSEVKWFVISETADHPHPSVQIEGGEAEVEKFIRACWGDGMWKYEDGDTEAAKIETFFASYALVYKGVQRGVVR